MADIKGMQKYGFEIWEKVPDQLAVGDRASRFKKEDMVQRKSDGITDIVVSVPGMPEYDKMRFISASEGFCLKKNGWEYQKDWLLVSISHPSVPKYTKIDPSRFYCASGELLKTAGELLKPEAKSPEKNMNILNAFQRLFMDVDAQTLRKAGYIHEDSTLTDEGNDALGAILIKNNKAEFVAAAQAKLDEIAAQKKQ
jgi:hypothetical protein